MTTGAEERGARWLRTDNLLLAALLGVVMWVAGGVLLLVFAGLLLALGLDGLAGVLKNRTRLPRGLALLVVIALFLGFFALIGVTIVPQFLGELDELSQRLAEAGEQALDTLSRYEWARELMSSSSEQGQITDVAGIVAQRAASALLALFGILGSVVILLTIAVFAAADPALYRNGLLTLIPRDCRDRVDEALSATAHALRWWFLGQVISMVSAHLTPCSAIGSVQ